MQLYALGPTELTIRQRDAGEHPYFDFDEKGCVLTFLVLAESEAAARQLAQDYAEDCYMGSGSVGSVWIDPVQSTCTPVRESYPRVLMVELVDENRDLTTAWFTP